MFLLSLPMRGAWIEILEESYVMACYQSLPMRGAWIEMGIARALRETCLVAPHAGSVD